MIRKNPYIHYYARFAGNYARLLAAHIREAHRQLFFPADEVLALSERLHRHIGTHRHRLPESCGPEGLAVISVLEDLLKSQPERSTPGRWGRLRHYLSEHVSEPTVLNSIAADLGMARSTLTRLARSQSGTSVQQLHEEIKMDWARTLLFSTSASVAEVARRVGYADPFYFSRVFKKHAGCSPRAFRESP